MPSISIMTEKFASAAELMCRVLGADDHRFVVIEHPISSADLGSLADRARRATEECVALLLR